MTDQLAGLGPCPSCGAGAAFYTHAAGPVGGPEPGAVLICAACAAGAVVGDDGRRRCPTPKEASKLALNVRYVTARGSVLLAIAERRGTG